MAKKKPIPELLQAAQRKQNETAVAGKPEVDELRDEDKLVVVKPLSYAGEDYERGDEIVLGGYRWDDKLMRNGFFTTPELAERGQLMTQHADFKRTALRPAEREWNQAKRSAEEARHAVAAAEAELQAQRERLELAEDAYRRAEDRLRGILGDFLN